MKVDGEPFAVAATEDRGLAVGLCDGTADWGDGQRGSRIAVETMVKMLSAGRGDAAMRLKDAMLLGGLKMIQSSAGDAEDFPPCCLASLLQFHDDRVDVAWIGDGPVFLIRDGRVVAQTRPHLLIDLVIAEGRFTPEQLRDFPHKQVICRALGGHGPHESPSSQPDTTGPWALLGGDRIVSCYRRVVDAAGEESLARLVSSGDAESAVERLLATTDREGPTPERAAIVVTVG